MSDSTEHSVRSQRARLALDGLSIGDGFGQRFFFPWVVESATRDNLPEGPWHYTDDTEMAIGIVQILERHGSINEDELAVRLAARYANDPNRGYGGGAHELLRQIAEGRPWRTASSELFEGQGSFGNGGAMRSAPIGAWFADDIDATIDNAKRSAEVTHAHIEGQAGAIAVALAAGWAWRWNESGRTESPLEMLSWTARHLPECELRCSVERVATRSSDDWAFDIAREFGCGEQVTALDTVAYCLWLAASQLDDYCEALWTAARVGGDVDTTCAIVGGIVSLAVGMKEIPQQWRDHREPLSW